MKLEAFQAFSRQLKANLEADERVLGLVMLGSAAEQSRIPDEWSDHDFFVITKPGYQEAMRQEVDWLPDAEQVLLKIRETEHGLKVLYEDGHLLEYAIFDEAELELAKVNDYRVLFQSVDLETRLYAKAAKQNHHNYPSHFGQFVILLMIGSGRCARGEVLSGQMFIKQYALAHLLPLLVEYVASEHKAVLDNLDPFRRFERAYPQMGEALAQILELEPQQAARELLALADDHLSNRMPDYPLKAVEVIRTFL